jgi:hypothetical protein
MVMRRPFLSVFLLACGFSSAPLGSMAQAPSDAPASVSVPRPGSALVPGLHPRLRGEDHLPGIQDPASTPLASSPLHRPLAGNVIRPPDQSRDELASPLDSGRLTYRSNAPPAAI